MDDSFWKASMVRFLLWTVLVVGCGAQTPKEQYGECVALMQISSAPYTLAGTQTDNLVKLVGCLRKFRPDFNYLFENEAPVLAGIATAEDIRMANLILPYYESAVAGATPAPKITDVMISQYCQENVLTAETTLSEYKNRFKDTADIVDAKVNEGLVTAEMTACIDDLVKAQTLTDPLVGAASSSFGERLAQHMADFGKFKEKLILLLSCEGTLDCAGECNGDTEFDCAGACGGSAVEDCEGVCDGGKVVDCNGDCGGGVVKDCLDVCGGTAVTDCAGVCNGQNKRDCLDVCQGRAVEDCNGECEGTAVIDCNGDCGGTASNETQCQNKFCYGGNTDLREVDKVCIEQNDCVMSMRSDVCHVCAQNPGDNSVLKDCLTGECFTEETRSQMKVPDECGVCDGGKQTCKPHLISINPTLMPAGLATTFTANGNGFRSPGIRVVFIPKQQEIFQERNVVGEEPELPEIYATNIAPTAEDVNVLTGTIQGLAIGQVYRVGVEWTTGPRDVQEAQVYVYNERGITVTGIEPTEVTLDASSSQIILYAENYKLELFPPFQQTNVFIVKGISDRPTTVPAYEHTKTTEGGSVKVLRAAVTSPAEGASASVCLSVDGKNEVGQCQTVTFFQRPPAVQSFKLSSTGEKLAMVFDLIIDTTGRQTCEEIFEEVTSFGSQARCEWSPSKRELNIILGTLPTITKETEVVVRAGLMAVSPYRRAATSITRTPEYPESVPIPVIVITSWPDVVTGCSASVKLEIAVNTGLAGRPPQSIVWKMDESEPVEGGMSYEPPLSRARLYTIMVTVKNYLGGEATHTGTVTKSASQLPAASISVAGDTQLHSDGNYHIRPQKGYRLVVVYEYGDCSTDINRRWKMDGKLITLDDSLKVDVRRFDATKCGDTFKYSLETFATNAPDTVVENSVSLYVECELPVAIIIPTVTEILVGADGPGSVVLKSASFDPDGAAITPRWRCIFDGDQDCTAALGLDTQASSPEVTIPYSKLVVNTVYDIRLIVRATKGESTVTSEPKTVQVRVIQGVYPQVSILTARSMFRGDLPLQLQANVGRADSATWRLVEDDECAFNAASGTDVGTASEIKDRTSTFTIPPGTLRDESQCTVRIRATDSNHPNNPTEADLKISVYKRLSNCVVRAPNAITELEEIALTLESCTFDASLTFEDLRMTCTLKGATIYGFRFIVPELKDRTTTQAKFMCTVTDKLGHKLAVESNTASVNLLAAQQIKSSRASKVAEHRRKGKGVEAFEMLASGMEVSGASTTEEDRRTALAVLDEVTNDEMTAEDKRRLLVGMGKMKDVKTTDEESRRFAGKELQLLRELCRSRDLDSVGSLSQDDIKNLLDSAKEFVEQGAQRVSYREVEKYLACVTIKQLKHSETVSVTRENWKHRYTVSNLDNTDDDDTGLTFPQEVTDKCKLRDCGDSQMCEGCGLKYELYVEQDPPDIKTARQDNDCLVYIYVEILNPRNGEGMLIEDLKSPLTVTIPANCPNHKCYFYNTRTEWFDTDGVVAKIDADGNKICSTTHLTMFTVESEPVYEKKVDIVLIACAVTGGICCIVTIVIIVMAIKRSGSSKIGSHGDKSILGSEKF